jgi:hypothetical protein
MADNYTSSAKPITREGAKPGAVILDQARVDGYCACCDDDFFFSVAAFCVDEDVFCPEPAGAWRTSPQGSGAF